MNTMFNLYKRWGVYVGAMRFDILSSAMANYIQVGRTLDNGLRAH